MSRICNGRTDCAAGILIAYTSNMDKIRDAYWAQIFTVYSVIIAAAVGMLKGTITKFHCLCATMLVGSPLMFYVALYAIRSMRGNRHRLQELFDTGTRQGLLCRIVAIGNPLVWATFVAACLLLPDDHFSQGSCEASSSFDSVLLVPLAGWFFTPVSSPVVFPFLVIIAVGPWVFVTLRHRETIRCTKGVFAKLSTSW
jgi:hypothetical protein